MKFICTISFLILPFWALNAQSTLDTLLQKWEAAKSIGPGAEANALGNISNHIYIKSDDWKKATPYLKLCIQKAKESGLKGLQLVAMAQLGELYYYEGKFDSSHLVLQAGISYADEYGMTNEKLLLLSTQSSTYREEGNMGKAYECLLRAVREMAKCSDCTDEKKLYLYDRISWYSTYVSGDMDKALEWCSKYLSAAKKAKNLEAVSTAYGRMGDVFGNTGQLDSSEHYLNLAYQLAVQEEQFLKSKGFLPRLADAQIQKGNRERALGMALELIGEANQQQTQEPYFNDAIIIVGEAYQALGQTDRARRILNQLVISENADFGEKFILQDYYELMSKIEKNDNPAKALDYYQKYIAIRDTIQEQMYNVQLAEVETASNLAEQELENKQLQFEKEKETERAKNFKIALFAAAGVLLLLSFAVFYIHKTAQKNKRLAEELGQTNQLLEQKSEALQTANADLELFSYSLAHDIQSYVTQALNYTFFLDDKPGSLPEAQALDFMKKARRSIKGLHTFCRDLISYARSGQDASEPEEVELNEVLAEVRSALLSQIEEAGVQLNVPHDLPEVIAHQPRMVQLFQNLIGNAVKYRRAGVVPTIQVSFEEKGDDYLFTVSDNGQGIPPERIGRLFDLFVKGDMGGSGIGLAVCKRIVEGYGGRIWVESEVGKGSQFCFTIPA